MQFAVARAYGNIQQILNNASAQSPVRQTGTAGKDGRAMAAGQEKADASIGSVAVSLSAAALHEAANDAAGQSATQADFSSDVILAAQARLAERRTAEGGAYLPAMIAGLPLLPENQQLLDRIRQEIQDLEGQRGESGAASERYNQLLNLATCLQVQGWQKPLTENDLQREVDVADATAALAEKPRGDGAALDGESLDPMSGWRLRWRQDGREMPDAGKGSTPDWLGMAAQAGWSADDFLAETRSLAGRLQGEALTGAVENLIALPQRG